MSLTFDDVRFRYTDAGPYVLDGVSLTVGVGESCALMAPSGEGKSTLLSVAAGLLRPSSGEVSITDGSVGAGPAMPGDRGRVTWMFQGPSVLSRRSARDNVALPLVASGADHASARRAADQALALVGLAPWASAQVRRLSGGQAQRVAIARAIVTRPSVMLADEPTASLDFDTGRVVVEELLRTMSDAAVLIATHDSRIASLASRIVRLERGRLVEAVS